MVYLVLSTLLALFFCSVLIAIPVLVIILLVKLIKNASNNSHEKDGF